MQAVSRLFGWGTSTLSSRLSVGEMTDEQIEKIATLFNMRKDDLILKPDSGPVTAAEATAGDADMIISYICDIGKIQTEILREIKDFRKDVVVAIDTVNGNVAVCAKETHNTGEAVRNGSVAINKNVSNIYNHLKFGGK